MELQASRTVVEDFVDDVQYLWYPPGGVVPILDTPPTALQFLRDFVSPSRPCIIRCRGTQRTSSSYTNNPLSWQALSDAKSNPHVADCADAGSTSINSHNGGQQQQQQQHGEQEQEQDDYRNDPDSESLFGRNTLVKNWPDLELVVDASPDGHADVVRFVDQRCMFVQPEQRRMTVLEFFQGHDHPKKNISSNDGMEPWAGIPHTGGNGDEITDTEWMERNFSSTGTTCIHDVLDSDVIQSSKVDGPHHDGGSVSNNNSDVLYYSRQNDCLRLELAPIWEANANCHWFPTSFPWAEEAFDTGAPQAINLWIGNEKVVSAMHKDHYENLFYVARGQKVFTVCPPADAPFLYERDFPAGQFVTNPDGHWQVQPLLGDDHQQPVSVKWIEADVTRRTDPDYLRKFPLLKYTHAMDIIVGEGDLLYLPALWFHRVTQTCETIGINFWYDMKFDSPHWIYFHLLQQLTLAQHATENSTV